MRNRTVIGTLLTIIILVLAAFFLYPSPGTQAPPDNRKDKSKTVPVEIAPIISTTITQRRTFSGALEPSAEFIVAPKISGRIKSIKVDLADIVTRGELVCELDSDEYLQAVTQAEADLAVASANLTSAENDLATAERDLLRVTTLNRRGVASEAQYDSAKASQSAKQAEKEVAEAQLLRARSLLETVKIRLGYTRISADWSGGADQRVVAERFANEGDTVSANSPLLRIVELSPIIGVIHIAERDYGLLQPGLHADITNDAFPQQNFPGRISRISPAFKTATRQARVELLLDNDDHRLKPGMFIRATIVLARHDQVTAVPRDALTRRTDKTGIFILDDQQQTVRWQEIETGLEDERLVEIISPKISGAVVTLGQQQLAEGSKVTVSTSQTSQP